MAAPLLGVTSLSVGIRRKGRSDTVIVDDVSFEIPAGERFGIVGESGSGKSLTLRAIADLLPKGVEVLSGSIRYNGAELVGMPTVQRRRLMGPEIAMIFQEPMTALNPVIRVGTQIAEGPRRYLGLSKKAAMDLAIQMMAKTGIPDPARRARAYPHELSGGLRQRIMIAMAVSCGPRLLLCDEPTTALDVTVQHQVLRLLESLCADNGTSLAFVSHDLAVVNQTCTDLAVMYSGHIVESGKVKEILRAPRHPYTKGLLDSAPDFDQPDRRLVSIPGFPPNLAARPSGCPFAPRCSFAVDACLMAMPPTFEIAPGHETACIESERIFERSAS
ncbi:ABC transporter ATP-binding protein [Gryllotalpicola sp.]|uniref:ABC transporter ATP-binding protein n=1 Tax=Gryllotalpicola sp. TaxID=1932787 RepID=UPI0026340BFD|nr:ABC transporter ATP-binding protein [Gryllotalpicola sp.]